jgi:hypothetical protein
MKTFDGADPLQERIVTDGFRGKNLFHYGQFGPVGDPTRSLHALMETLESGPRREHP